MLNENYLKLSGAYLFAEIAHRVKSFRATEPDAKIISLGIGDVTQPLCPAVVEALHKATDEMSVTIGFRGYGPERGYDFLREAIVVNDYKSRGVSLSADEVFIGDGAKSDIGNFQELLSTDVRIAVTDPVYPVYVDSNVMSGRAGTVSGGGNWSDIVYLPCTAENNFVPQLPTLGVDVVYLCYPNNPTGTTLTRKQLKKWVDYALRNDVLIFYDSAYEAYIRGNDVPHSIYEIEGAKKVAVEFRSYSKTAGFTGLRCGYTVVPFELTVATDSGSRAQLNPLWSRRQSTKFNGASYLSQRAAEAIYTSEGKQQVQKTIGYYMQNASLMRTALTAMGLQVFGGVDAPYLWVKIPDGYTSWSFFEDMLRRAHVVCTPGVGFGPSGEGFVRLTAFGSREQTEEALEKIKEKM